MNVLRPSGENNSLSGEKKRLCNFMFIGGDAWLSTPTRGKLGIGIANTIGRKAGEMENILNINKAI